jgi:hypothetical protein
MSRSNRDDVGLVSVAAAVLDNLSVIAVVANGSDGIGG